MLLQGFFFALNLYGWTAWVRARDDSGIPVGWLSARARRLWGSATVAAWAMWSAAMHRFTDAAAPWIDGAIAMLSITAQGLLAWRRVESGWLWIFVDRSEEHTSELQSLMRISYAVFCLKKKTIINKNKV